MYKVIDYWSNGYLDVTYGEELIAEVQPSKEGMVLSFAIRVPISCREELDLWLDQNISHMVALHKL